MTIEKKIKIWFAVIGLISILLLNFRGVFLNDKDATELAINSLAKRGYSNAEVVKIHRYWTMGCDRGDAIKIDVVAVNPSGNKTEVFVCSRWPFKGSTVRTD